MYFIAMVLAMRLAGEVLPARVDQPAGPVRFDPESDQPDWEALAKQKLGAEAVDHPPAATLQRLWESRGLFDDASVSYTVNLPDPLKAKNYYLVSTRGIIPLTPDSFEGQVHYIFDENATPPKVSRIDYAGEIVAKLAGPPDQTAAGFVFVSDQPLIFEVKPVELSSVSGAPTSIAYVDNGVRRTAKVEPNGHTDQVHFASRVLVEPSHEDYLFVQWKPDDSFCESSFSLLKITGPAMEEVKWSAYDCDI